MQWALWLQHQCTGEAGVFRTSSVTREDGPAAKRICLRKQKYVDMPENDFVNAAVMAAGNGNFNASQAQQLAKAARRCGAEGKLLRGSPDLTIASMAICTVTCCRGWETWGLK